MELIELLPYDETMVIQNRKQKVAILNLLRHFVAGMISAVDAFQAGELEKFDAQVGETSCQIRAHKILALKESDLEQSLPIFSNSIERLHYKIENIYQNFLRDAKRITEYNTELDDHKPVKIFIQKLDVNEYFSDDLIFLLTSYLLCFFCKEVSNIHSDILNYRFIQEYLEVSKTNAKKIIFKLQAINSRLSCEHMCKIAKKIYDNEISKFIENQILISEHGRTVMPCFILTKIIMDDMITSNKSILFLIKDSEGIEVELLFKSENGEFRFMDSRGNEISNVLVFKGVTSDSLKKIGQYISQFENYKPYNLILANMAKHPQFSGEKLAMFRNSISPNPLAEISQKVLNYLESFKKRIDFSEKIGAHIDDQRAIYIQHVYSKQILQLPPNYIMLENGLTHV